MTLTPGRFAGQTLDLRATSSQRAMPSTTVAGIGGVGFSPLHLRGLALWLDAADTSTITSASNKVSQWNDKSGWGRNVTQATASLQPSSGTRTLNGRNVIDYTPTKSLKVTYAATLPQASTVVVVATLDSQAVTRYVFDGVDSTNRNAIYAAATNGVFTLFASGSSGVSNDGGTADTNPHVLSALFRGASNSTVHIDGSLAITATSLFGSGGAGGLCLGARFNDTEGLDGCIAEVAIYNRELSAPERRSLELHLRTKWGI